MRVSTLSTGRFNRPNIKTDSLPDCLGLVGPSIYAGGKELPNSRKKITICDPDGKTVWVAKKGQNLKTALMERLCNFPHHYKVRVWEGGYSNTRHADDPDWGTGYQDGTYSYY